MEHLLTVKEAADVMRVSAATIYSWVRSGEIAALKVGRTIRIRPEALSKTAQVRAARRTESEKDALARLLTLVKDNVDDDVLNELERRAREREAKEPPHHGEAQVLAFGKEDSRVR